MKQWNSETLKQKHLNTTLHYTETLKGPSSQTLLRYEVIAVILHVYPMGPWGDRWPRWPLTKPPPYLFLRATGTGNMLKKRTSSRRVTSSQISKPPVLSPNFKISNFNHSQILYIRAQGISVISVYQCISSLSIIYHIISYIISSKNPKKISGLSGIMIHWFMNSWFHDHESWIMIHDHHDHDQWFNDSMNHDSLNHSMIHDFTIIMIFSLSLSPLPLS